MIEGYKRFMVLGSFCIGICLCSPVRGDDYFQNFDSWTGPPAIPFGSGSSTDLGWSLTNVITGASFPSNSPLYAVWLQSQYSQIVSPPLTSGIGGVTFYDTTWSFAAGPVSYSVDYSTNAGSSWVTISTINSNAPLSTTEPWLKKSLPVVTYSTAIVRIRKTSATGSQFIGFDDVRILRAPPYVGISNITFSTFPVEADTVTEVNVDIEPFSFASNIVASLFYSTNSVDYIELTLSNTVNFTYTTAPQGILVGNPGTVISYYIEAAFDGDGTNVTQREPLSAPATPYTTMVRGRTMLSTYTNMTVSGPPAAATNMLLSSDYLWRGITLKNSWLSPEFVFQSGADTWGDSAQIDTYIPLSGVAQHSSASNILVNGMVTNNLLFTFDDRATNLDYSIQQCEYVNFDTWTGADSIFSTYNNGENWYIYSARTTDATETNKALLNKGRAVILQGGTNGIILSPLMPNGIGAISFRYRNWLDNGSTSASFRIESSTNGADWTEHSNKDVILTRDYIYHTYAIRNPSARYARLLNTSSNNNTWLCFDDIAVTKPGALVLLSNPSPTPAPTAGGQPQNISINFDVSGGASNLVPKLYWLSIDAQAYDSAPMTTTGGTFYATLPPTLPGIVKYYYECIYDGFEAGPSRYPASGYLAYTNISALGPKRTQAFDAWTGSNPSTATDADGWQINSVSLSGGFGNYSDPTSCWFVAGSSFWQSPVLSNGVESVLYAIRNWTIGAESNAEYRIDISTNGGAAWTPVETRTNLTQTWELKNCDYRTYVDTLVRVSMTNMTTGLLIGFDSISIPPPSADVIITNLFLTPGYPGTSDTVAVSCDIFTADERVRAFDFQPKLAFRPAGGSWATNPMTQKSSSKWEGEIPPQDPNTVEYFIRCDFAGYYYTNGLLSTKRTPAFLPDGPATQDQPDSFREYIPRRFRSEFDSLSVSSSVGNVTMSLVADNTWQGIFRDVTTTQLLVNFSGLAYFTGSGYDAATNYWGDDGQIIFDTPFSGTAFSNQAPIVANIETSSMSQVMFRFNSASGAYEVRRCAYQDFNIWRPHGDLFTKSLNLADIFVISNSFDTWATNVTYVTPTNSGQANFEDWRWDQTEEFLGLMGPNDWPSGGPDDGYWAEDFRIRHEIDNVACEFTNAANAGAIWPDIAELTDGLEKLTWRARCRFKDDYLTWYTNGLNWTNYAVTAKLKGSDGAGYPALSILAYYQNSSNYYECRVQGTNSVSGAAKHNLHIYKVINGTPSWIWSKTGYGGSISDERTITLRITPRDNAICLKLDASGVNETVIDSATNLIGGSIGLMTDDAKMIADDISTVYCNYRSFNSWSNNGNYISFTDGGWDFKDCRTQNDSIRLYSNGTSWARSPYLPVPPAKFVFSLAREGTEQDLYVEGATNLVDGWVTITNITSFGTSWDTNKSVTGGMSSYKYLRVRNNATNGIARFDWMYIEGVTNYFTENFSSGVATNWQDDSGYWSVTNNTYERQAYCGPTLSFLLEMNTNFVADYPSGNWPDIHTYTISNNQYESFSTNFHYWAPMFTSLKHISGNAHLRVDDVTMYSWRAVTNYLDTNNWMFSEGWVSSKASDTNDHQLELWRSRANPATGQWVRTPLMTNGIGDFNFKYRFDGITGTNKGKFDIEAAWSPLTAFSVTNTLSSTLNGTWTNFTMTMNMATTMYMRVVHKSASTNIVLTIDDFEVADYRKRDDRTWEGYNALVTDNQDSREFEPFYVPGSAVKTAYLNNHPSAGADSTYTNFSPYIQSARVKEGIGFVSFWYRSWDPSGSPTGAITLYVAPTETSTNWVQLGDPITVSETQYRLYQSYFYNTNAFLRITAATNGPDRICIDNVTIAEPLLANLDIQSINLSPEVPLYTDSVKVSAKLGHFVLNPSNIQARAYYNVGTNDWGNLSGNWISTNFVVLDTVVSNGPYGIILESSTNIPVQNIDTVVQYYVECTFDGLFSEYSSPKTGRVFTTPSWYYPVNLNSNKAVANPYYFVFSCTTGAVWINEFNYKVFDDAFGDQTNEFVELAGVAGSDIGGWRIELLKGAELTYDYNVVSNGISLLDETNGFGFYVWGDLQVSHLNAAFTTVSNQNIETSGGIRLKRSMGAWVDLVEYGGGLTTTNLGYRNAGSKGGTLSSLFLAGPGSSRDDFYWTNVTVTTQGLDPTWDPISFAGIANGFADTNQIFLAAVIPGPTITLVNFWTTSTNTWLVFRTTGYANEITPKTWYTTNLIYTNWTAVTASNSYAQPSSTYTQWFGNVTNPAPVYFKVTSTNDP